MKAATLLALLWSAFGAREDSILGELERLDQQLVGAEAAVRRDAAARGRLQAELAGVEAALASARLHEHSVYMRYRRRLRGLDRLRGGVRWVLLGGSTSLLEYLQTTRLLRQVTAADHRLHVSLQQEQQRLQSLVTAAAAHRRSLDAAIAESRARRDALAADRRARADLLAKVRAERATATALARERRVAQDKLRAMVAHLQPQAGPPTPRALPERPSLATTGMRPGAAPRSSTDTVRDSFAHNRGRLPWPALGPLKVAFGQRVELAFGTVTSHNGWDIAAASGTRVQAVAPGQVVYAGWLRGYGQMVIVDHGGGYHSVTAHLASIDVQVGDGIAAGQLLGTVGDTGSLRGTVLYFEIRHRGAPQDPRLWLRN